MVTSTGIYKLQLDSPLAEAFSTAVATDKRLNTSGAAMQYSRQVVANQC
ncbi:MAG: hypothetical protein ACI92S_002023 [Planctomycetaceae bacterium]|jgi:hypothetical protein